ncbi:MFS transporter [Catenulispora yoronensis]|uniref:MFS transporter n=1 Tax=Catenulispora yoronensis TaxID=450799 RepID=A0ABP5GJN4_9ACTN
MSEAGKTSYRAVLAVPHALSTFAAALVGRLAYGVVFLALVLTVSRSTGSYSAAGAALALFGLTSSVLAPYRARLVDRHEARRVLLPMAGLCSALLAGIAVVGWQSGAHRFALWVLAAAAGGCVPPLGAFMRTLWARLVPDEQLLQRAYSLDAVGEELLYVLGPLLAGIFTAFNKPALGVAFSAALLLGGTVFLASSPAAANTDPAADPDSDSPDAAAASASRSLWAGTGLIDPVLVTGGLGLCLGALDLLVVAFAGAHGSTAEVSWVTAAMAAGSAVGGLLYGARSWRWSLRARLPVLAVALGLFCAAAGHAGTMVLFVLAAAVVGLLISPILTTAYLISGELGAIGRGTEASAWVNSAFNAGNAAGAAGIGLVLTHLSLRWCFALAGAPLLVPAALVLARLARRDGGGDGDAEPSGSTETAEPSKTPGTPETTIAPSDNIHALS